MIAILTQSPGAGLNYGCLMQAYALQQVINSLNFDCLTLDLRRIRKKRSFFKHIQSFFYRFYQVYLRKNKNIPSPFHQWDFTENHRQIICQNTLKFVKKHIKMSMPMNIYELDKYDKIDADIFIVGSDQVWRPRYSPGLEHFFLDFVKEKKDIKRIAYAVSFGLDDGSEYTSRLLKICKPLAQKFDAISVRELSGVKLCRELFDADAVQVLDPTLLLDTENYIKLSYERNDFKNNGNLFTYVLDEAIEKQNIIEKIAKVTTLKPFSVLPKAKFHNVGPKYIKDCILPSVEQWLRGFVDARYVVTDSFHGTVFSILFKRPFITIGNSYRGMARFTSLLKIFGLEDRLVFNLEDVTEELINRPINYDKVYEILGKERIKSKNFLFHALNKN